MNGGGLTPGKLGRSNFLRPVTRQVIWARSAGRCQYRDCNENLIDDLVSGRYDANFGFVAHIVSDDPNGPRGDDVRSHLLADNAGNLMLLCSRHHKLVDVVEVLAHPEPLLKAMKAAHEDRIATLTAVKEARASHALCYGANIGGHESPVHFDRVRADMVPHRYPADGRPIQIEVLGSSLHDGEAAYWPSQVRNLRREFAAKVGERIQSREVRHLSVFALAPQPLLFELGRLLCDIVPANVHQLHREPQGWRWAEDAAPISFVARRPARTAGPPALVLGLSATVSDERIGSVLGAEASIWSIEVATPHNDVMRRKDDLREFRRLVRHTLDAIKAEHGEAAHIHVFPALPVSAAVEFGRVWMPKADLPLRVYDQQRSQGGFVRAIDIGLD